jgi:hypothetical protein
VYWSEGSAVAPATDIAVRGSSHGGYAASTKNTAIAAIASNTGRSAIITAAIA